MEKKTNKKSNKFGNVLAMLCFILLGAVCGVVMMKYIDTYGEGISLGETLFQLAFAFVGMYLAIFLQIIVHEAGHLAAGLCSGYTFSSFRIGSFMWSRENGKVKFSRLTLAGTGGQCLMNPPDMVDGKMPYVFYNLGGSLMNLFSILVCGVLFVFFSNAPFFSLFLLMMCVVGFGYALINGVPMKLGAVNNDGSNAWELGKTPEAMRAFWVQLKVAEQTAKGLRLKEMPEEWFYLPDEEGMKNSMIAVMGVFYENRLMDEEKFEEAKPLIDQLLNMESGIAGLYRNMLVCDRIYCELIRDGDSEVVDKLYTKEQKTFMKQMRNFPVIIRTEYVYALLYEKDTEKAAQIKERFEKCAKTHPYAVDIESERELMENADGLYQKEGLQA